MNVSGVRYIDKDRLHREPNIYLTFDDGPNPGITEKILRLLEKQKVWASFFVIVQKALAQTALISVMQQAGHAVGNHSWDHSYRPFFRCKNAMEQWIRKGEEELNALLDEENIGFRPPAGICTPLLKRTLEALKLPLVLWNIRFYDTQFQWTKRRAFSAIRKLQPGDIILLHDRMPRGSTDLFLDTLSAFIEKTQEMGFCFKPLKRELYT